MTAHIAVNGRLGSDPTKRTAQSGKDWATSSIAVKLSDEDDAPAQWFGIVAFGRVAETLSRQQKGDIVSISGRLQLNRWRDNAGAEREQLQIVADTVISARSVRSGGGRKSA